MSYEVLEQIPSTTIRVPVAGTLKREKPEFVTVQVDNDYDGEWFATLRLIYSPKLNMVMVPMRERRDRWMYLHHLILPPKRGYWRVFADGNHLNIRSCNVIYATPSQVNTWREERKYDRQFHAWLNKMKQLKQERGG